MSGTISGGRRAAEKNKAKDPDFYKKIGEKGGKISRGGGWAIHELAVESGRKGGMASRRGPNKPKGELQQYVELTS